MKLWEVLRATETFPSATVREFIEAWLKSKAPPVVAQSTHDLYRKSTRKFLEFLGPAAELDASAATRKIITEFRNQVAQKASATTTNHDLQAIKLIFSSAKRDGYIIKDPKRIRGISSPQEFRRADKLPVAPEPASDLDCIDPTSRTSAIRPGLLPLG